MHKLSILSIAAVTLLANVAIALADEASGRVTEINFDEETFSLDNGMTFTVSEDIKIDGLAPGQEVKVTYEKQGSENVATEVESPED